MHQTRVCSGLKVDWKGGKEGREGGRERERERECYTGADHRVPQQCYSESNRYSSVCGRLGSYY